MGAELAPVGGRLRMGVRAGLDRGARVRAGLQIGGRLLGLEVLVGQLGAKAETYGLGLRLCSKEGRVWAEIGGARF